MQKRLFAMLLVMLMVIGSVCIPVRADDDGSNIPSGQSEGGGGTGGGESGGGTGGGESGGGTGGGESGGGTGGGESGGGTGGGETGGGTGGGETGGGTGGGETGGGTGGGSTGGGTCSHTYGSWTSTGDKHKRTCTLCNESQEALHSWNSGSVTLAPTCTAEGSISYTCTACGATKAEVLKMVAHKYSYDCDERCDLCDGIREVTHKSNGIWSKNSVHHWHLCKTCGDVMDKANHYPGPAATEEADQICLTCGYIMTPKKSHTHKYATEYSKDASGHWYACSGCDEQGEFAAHTYTDACDSTCNDCEFEIVPVHNFDDVVRYDETNHWLECASCGVREYVEAHTPGPEATEDTPQLCVRCDYEFAPAIGSTATVPEGMQWAHDETSHWLVNEKGKKQDEALHTWDNGKDRWDGQVVYTCSVCKAQRVGDEAVDMEDTTPQKKSFPWGAVILVVLILLFVGAATVLFLLLKPKKKDAPARVKSGAARPENNRKPQPTRAQAAQKKAVTVVPERKPKKDKDQEIWFDEGTGFDQSAEFEEEDAYIDGDLNLDFDIDEEWFK